MNKPEIEGLKTKILIVDDTIHNLQLLTAILNQRGYSVIGAPDGSTALMIAQNEPPDLILLDILMPEMDGFEVCERLKSDVKTESIPVIFISSLDDIEDKIKGFSLGGADYITKPFQEEEVFARVNTHVTLRRMQKRLEEQNDELERRVQERTNELLKAKNAAEVASLAKSEFIANISHEFRTPLNSVIGFTSILMENANKSSTEYKYLNFINISGMELLKIIDNLIELSRIESEGIQLNKKLFELSPFLNYAIENIYNLSVIKGLKVRYEIDKSVPDTIIADSELLLTILDQLGKNAVKFTEKGEIIISVCKALEYERSPALHFSVRDTGVGIPEDRLKNIFMDFTQADGSYTRKYGGLGLGLTLVRRIISHIGGCVWAESIEGKGSTFHFTFPIE
ncbi:MAG: response regulator [Desulfobacterales bacterium]|nr:response regulator [Desulfobacterales bacterium]